MEVCQEIVGALHVITRFSWCALMTTDSETRLPSGGVVEGFTPETCVPFWDNELTEPDFLKFSDLARSVEPVATLHATVDGDLDRSPRHRNLYAPLGAVDELRIAFVVGSSCLAIGTFVRSASDGVFPPEEIAEVRRLIPIANRVLRNAMGRVRSQRRREPVVLVFDQEDRLVATTPGGRRVLDQLRIEIDDEMPALLRVAAARVRCSRSPQTLTTRVQERSGEWLRMHAAHIEENPGAVAFTIAPASPDDIVYSLLDSYGLTERETEISLCVIRGLSSKDIASELLISVHTVRDHIKVIFTKAGVASRGELMAQLLTNNVLGGLERTVGHMASVNLDA